MSKELQEIENVKSGGFEHDETRAAILSILEKVSDTVKKDDICFIARRERDMKRKPLHWAQHWIIRASGSCTSISLTTVMCLNRRQECLLLWIGSRLEHMPKS